MSPSTSTAHAASRRCRADLAAAASEQAVREEWVDEGSILAFITEAELDAADSPGGLKKLGATLARRGFVGIWSGGELYVAPIQAVEAWLAGDVASWDHPDHPQRQCTFADWLRVRAHCPHALLSPLPYSRAPPPLSAAEVADFRAAMVRLSPRPTRADLPALLRPLDQSPPPPPPLLRRQQWLLKRDCRPLSPEFEGGAGAAIAVLGGGHLALGLPMALLAAKKSGGKLTNGETVLCRFLHLHSEAARLAASERPLFHKSEVPEGELFLLLAPEGKVPPPLPSPVPRPFRPTAEPPGPPLQARGRVQTVFRKNGTAIYPFEGDKPTSAWLRCGVGCVKERNLDADLQELRKLKQMLGACAQDPTPAPALRREALAPRSGREGAYHAGRAGLVWLLQAAVAEVRACGSLQVAAAMVGAWRELEERPQRRERLRGRAPMEAEGRRVAAAVQAAAAGGAATEDAEAARGEGGTLSPRRHPRHFLDTS